MDPKEKELQERADSLQLIPRMDVLTAVCADVLRRNAMDDQLAVLWSEKLRHSYTRVLEFTYPELQAESGQVLPIDTSVPASALEYEYYMSDSGGCADWIDETDGDVMPEVYATALRRTGRTYELGAEYTLSKFDLEKASAAGVQLKTIKQAAARKAHALATNWVWHFGDSQKGLVGFCNHPNIQVTAAPDGAGGGSNPAHYSVKTVDEILADIATVVDEISNATQRAHKAAVVFIPEGMRQRMRNLRLGAGDGFASLWDMVMARYGGDDDQPRIEFRVLNMASASYRTDPRVAGTPTDTSGLSGDFMIARADLPTDEQAFIRARPFTQLPPQEWRLKMHHITHSKIGGCRLTRPLAVHRMDFGSAPA